MTATSNKGPSAPREESSGVGAHRRGGKSGVRAKHTPERDQDKSSFTKILERLLSASPGATGAALVDSEGETVDYAGYVDPFELKVAAAHWQIVLGEISEAKTLGAIRQLQVRARTRSYVVRQIQSSYAVVVILHRHAGFAISERALQEADARLSVEAGWEVPRDQARWFGVDVQTDKNLKRRPARIRVAGAWQPVEVMGSMVGLRAHEKGFRIRLATGAEMLLIRERLGRWFADEHVEE
jgi:hypothetical protein